MAPTPLPVTDTAVTLSRAEWEAFLDRLEDSADEAVIAAFIAERERIGDEAYRRLCYTSAEVDRRLGDGVSTVTIWREREGLTQRALATAAGISQSYLAEIERGKKPGSLAAMAAIAKVLRIPLEHLAQSASGDAAV
jgi:DNA-binding XRE family transcriptional regulator